eukprot:153595-Chlamydomonas_euryale.AAC.4
MHMDHAASHPHHSHLHHVVVAALRLLQQQESSEEGDRVVEPDELAVLQRHACAAAQVGKHRVQASKHAAKWTSMQDSTLNVGIATVLHTRFYISHQQDMRKESTASLAPMHVD